MNAYTHKVPVQKNKKKHWCDALRCGSVGRGQTSINNALQGIRQRLYMCCPLNQHVFFPPRMKIENEMIERSTIFLYVLDRSFPMDLVSSAGVGPCFFDCSSAYAETASNAFPGWVRPA